jgi:hypothetical protein
VVCVEKTMRTLALDQLALAGPMNATPHAFMGVVSIEGEVLDGKALMAHGNRCARQAV